MIFELEKDEIKKLRRFEKHKCKYSHPFAAGAIGGRFSYTFTPTGLGIFVNVECMCGKKKLLTDVSKL